jgi:hypothetical protein
MVSANVFITSRAQGRRSVRVPTELLEGISQLVVIVRGDEKRKRGVCVFRETTHLGGYDGPSVGGRFERNEASRLVPHRWNDYGSGGTI